MAARSRWRSILPDKGLQDPVSSGNLAETTYPRYVKGRAKNPRWKGPHYLRTNHWHRDLMEVLEQIRVCVKTNAPLSPAFAAAAQDYIDVNNRWSSERVTRLLLIVGLMFLVLLSMAGVLLDFEEQGADAWEGLIQPILLGGWLLFVVARQGYKPVAVFAAMQRHVEAGNTLSEAMARLPRFFPSDLTMFVAVGEKTGNLDSILGDFTDETVKRWTAQRDLNRILRYIALVLIFQFAILFFLMTKVVPVFDEVLIESGISLSDVRDMPTPTIPLLPPAFVIALVSWLVAGSGRSLFLALFWVANIWFWLKPRRVRHNWGRRIESTVFFAIPVLRGMIVRQNLSSAAYMLHHLLRAGVPLEQAVSTVADGDLHPVYRRWFKRFRKRILNGDSLREASRGIQLLAPLPRSFVPLISMGESNGCLESTLAYIAEQYQSQVERRKNFLLNCVLPLGIFILGYIALSIEGLMFQLLMMMSDAMIL